MRLISEREIDVLFHAAGGKTNKQIADQLGISDHTVKFHMNNALKVLGATTRAAAVVVALRKGIFKIEDIDVQVASD